MTIIQGRTNELLTMQYTRMSHARWPPESWSIREFEGVSLYLLKEILFLKGKKLCDIETSGITGCDFAILFSLFDLFMEGIDEIFFLFMKSIINEWVIHELMGNEWLFGGIDLGSHVGI